MNLTNIFECLYQETQRLTSEPVPGIQAIPDEANARYFHVSVDGPEDVSCLSFPHWQGHCQNYTIVVYNITLAVYVMCQYTLYIEIVKGEDFSHIKY